MCNDSSCAIPIGAAENNPPNPPNPYGRKNGAFASVLANFYYKLQLYRAARLAASLGWEELNATCIGTKQQVATVSLSRSSQTTAFTR